MLERVSLKFLSSPGGVTFVRKGASERSGEQCTALTLRAAGGRRRQTEFTGAGTLSLSLSLSLESEIFYVGSVNPKSVLAF